MFLRIGDTLGASAYLTTPDGLKIELTTWDAFDATIGDQDAAGVGYVDRTQLYYEWPEIDE